MTRPRDKYDAALIFGGVANVGHDARARDFYRSTIFIAGSLWAAVKARKWYVLSPGNGVVGPDDMIAHHVRDLDAAGEDARRRWAAQCAKALDPSTTYAVVAPKNIRDALEAAGLKIVDPFTGRAGERVAAMFRDIDRSFDDEGYDDGEESGQEDTHEDAHRQGQVRRGSKRSKANPSR